MTAPTSACPVCGADSVYALSAVDRNRETTAERFVYNRCTACGTLFVVDVPEDLSPYYGGGYYQFDSNGEPPWKTDSALLAAEEFRARLLARHVQSGQLIDIGAGTGGFAAAAHSAGFEVTAIDMDARCCGYMESSLGVRAICSDEPIQALQALPAADVITLWHSLEHLRDPVRMLAAATANLKAGGVLAIGVPNPRSLQFRLLGARWPHLDAPRHLTLMPANALIAQGQRLGLQPLKLTTSDPSGLASNFHGWAYALRHRPASGPASPAIGYAAALITTALAPVERTGAHGAALTVLLQKREPTTDPAHDVTPHED